MSRIAVFIDGGYLNKVADDFGRISLDYARLIESVTEGQPVLRSYFYHCPSFKSDPPTEEENQRYQRQERFFAALKRLPDFEVRLGYLAHRGFTGDNKPVFEQKGADVWLAVDLVRLALSNKIDTACLIAGDGDFCPVVQSAKDAGVSIRLFHGPGPRSRYSSQLWDLCDQRSLLSLEDMKATTASAKVVKLPVCK